MHIHVHHVQLANQQSLLEVLLILLVSLLGVNLDSTDIPVEGDIIVVLVALEGIVLGEVLRHVHCVVLESIVVRVVLYVLPVHVVVIILIEVKVHVMHVVLVDIHLQ